MQENAAPVLDTPVTDQQFAEISDDGPEIGDQDGVAESSDSISGPADTTARRGRGRPPKQKADEPEAKPKKIRYFPVPVRKVVGVNKEFGQDEFFKYWKKIAADPELRDRAVCYVYRTFPVTNVNTPGDVIDEQSAKKPKYLDVTSQTLESAADVWARWGAGDYKFYLNDSDFQGRFKTQMTCYFTGSREWDLYPPLIDLKTVVMDDPKNGSYIRYLQGKGLMPKPGNEGEDDDMAGEALREMAGTVKDLTDKVIDMAHRPTPVMAAPQPIPEPRTAAGDAATIEAVTRSLSNANEVGVKMISKAIDTVNSVQAKAGDPVETVAKLVTTIKELFPKQDTSGVERLLAESQRRSEALEARLTQFADAQKDREIADLQKQLEAIRNQQQAQPPKDTLTQAREFAQLQREMREIFGGPQPAAAAEDDDEKPGREPWYVRQLPLLAGLGTFIINGAASIYHNMAVARTGQGNPVAPPPPPPEVLPPGVQQAAAGLVGAPPPQVAAPQQSMTPQQQQEQQIQMFVRIIETPLKRHLDDGLTGHDFAGWLVDSYGDTSYQQVRAAGADNILGAISRYSPSLFAEMQRIPERSQQFIAEFLQGPGDEETN